MKEIQSIPNASRTFEALRNLGYDLNSSIADVIDNSITEKVKAKNINVLIGSKEGKITCRIHDDGSGMSEFELEEAMRLGADANYGEMDLGKFGMGMKTASLSHCNTLTVISKRKRGDICAFRWDMSHVKDKGWALLRLNQNEIDKTYANDVASLNKSGTIVIWSDLFFLDAEYKSYNSDKLAENFFYRVISQLELHLSMVFHRFLDGSLGENNTIKIKVNNKELQAWDPFCRSEPQTQVVSLKKQASEFEIAGYDNPVFINAYILPTKESFSSEDAWKLGKGLLSWNDSQGYYIYRANRLIRFGGWHGTKAKDEHDKLARISIDIDSSLDELFRITVNKARIKFPELLFQHLKNVINPFVIKKAKTKYNKSEEVLLVKNNFRKQQQEVAEISKGLLHENNIKTKSVSSNTGIEVQNPSGTWLSNKINDFLKYGGDQDYEIVSGYLDSGDLWKILCNQNDKFKVIVNASHPFYQHVYKTSTNKVLTDTLDAFIFSLAFAELYNKTNQNAHLFDTFKAVCSQALEKLTNGKII